MVDVFSAVRPGSSSPATAAEDEAQPLTSSTPRHDACLPPHFVGDSLHVHETPVLKALGSPEPMRTDRLQTYNYRERYFIYTNGEDDHPKRRSIHWLLASLGRVCCNLSVAAAAGDLL